jgi:hypothetical protein
MFRWMALGEVAAYSGRILEEKKTVVQRIWAEKQKKSPGGEGPPPRQTMRLLKPLAMESHTHD